MHVFLQLVLALLPCALLMRLILFMDRNEREPLGLVMKILIMGAISVIPAALIEPVVEGLPFMKAAGLKHAFFESFLCAAPIEELCKLMPVVLFAWNRPEFNEENDGIVYAGASALGFALLENIFFVLSKGLLVGLMRALSSIPLHCFTGVVMGYYAGKAKFATDKKLPLLLTGFGWVYFVHGLYDTLCLSGSSLVVLLLPMMAAVAWIGMAVLKKGRQLSLDRAVPGPAAEGAISNVQGALPEQSRNIVFPKQVSSHIWKAVISRLLLGASFLFLLLACLGEVQNKNGNILQVLVGGIIIVCIPATVGSLLEISYRRGKRALSPGSRR
jgi:RsiW-degrading membrane proteinase PrsW (M82 family)